MILEYTGTYTDKRSTIILLNTSFQKEILDFKI